MFTACAKKPAPPQPPPPSPNVSGDWSGSGFKNNIPYAIAAKLSQADRDTAVSGTGDISALGIIVPFTTSGAVIDYDVRLHMTGTTQPIEGDYVGKFDSLDFNRIIGKASVPAFSLVNEPLTITRR